MSQEVDLSQGCISPREAIQRVFTVDTPSIFPEHLAVFQRPRFEHPMRVVRALERVAPILEWDDTCKYKFPIHRTQTL
jgi:hypothetical protein